MKVAILGANGFIGARAVEMFHLGGVAEVRPVVRSYARLSRAARFDLDWRLADARDAAALQAALAGCDAVLHAVVGDARVIHETVAPVVEAAKRAGVGRLIYLSSASVHGQAPPPDTDERSPLSDRQSMAYNNAKVRAERQLQKLRQEHGLNVVVLRPGVVYGPRSRWITDTFTDLRRGKAYLVQGGRGICNGLYVDNLIEAIRLALGAEPAIAGEAFLLGDREVITWADFYRPLARACGLVLDDIPSVEAPLFKPTWSHRLEALRTSDPVQAILPIFPARLKEAAKAALAAWRKAPSPSPWASPKRAHPVVTQEMALLQSCQWRFPIVKAERLLHYQPIVSFTEGMARSIRWLAFADYPVRGE